jgi:16S rRNA (cytosine967-C5)-methyltransferase
VNLRLIAVRVLLDLFEHNRKIDEALAAATDNAMLSERDRRLLHQIVFGVLRRYYSLEADVSRFLKQKPSEGVRLALLVGTYQLRYLRIPTHAAVSETVDAVKSLLFREAGFANAVLRKVAESEPPARLKPQQRAELPKWIYSAWRDAWGAEKAQAVAEILRETPPLCVAVFEARERWLAEVAELKIEATKGELSPHAVILPAGVDVTTLPGYPEGAFTVMDQAAQAAALALEVNVGERVLDLCAAPGGKTALLARMHPDVAIEAVELSGKRIPRLQENLTRLKADNVSIRQGDATALPYEDSSVDAILLDAPCSASGVIRRHPDAKFIHNQESVAHHAALQKQMLAEALRVLKPGGRLVYAVCSIHPEENEQVVEGVSGLQSADRLFPTEAHDGFFIARLSKG